MARRDASRPPERRDRLVREREHDRYRARRKPPEPTVCPECGAVFRGGRWCWANGPFDAPRSHCPACRRIRDGYPGGIVMIGGAYTEEHREELVGLARNVEARQKAEHPLERIMEVRPEGGGLRVTTTDPHLARAIGNALHAAHQGSLDYQYAEEDKLLRVQWSR